MEAVVLGATRQQAFFEAIGLLEASPVELVEAGRTAPLLPPKWTDLSTITISYGHGMAVTPLHLAAGYATLVNGGLRVRPSIVASGARPSEADRVISPRTSAELRDMMRQVVVRTVRRSVRREVLWNGNVEPPLWRTWYRAPDENIVRWAWTTRHAYRDLPAQVAGTAPHVTVVRIRSRRETARWLAALPAADSA